MKKSKTQSLSKVSSYVYLGLLLWNSFYLEMVVITGFLQHQKGKIVGNSPFTGAESKTESDTGSKFRDPTTRKAWALVEVFWGNATTREMRR